MVGLLSTHTF